MASKPNSPHPTKVRMVRTFSISGIFFGSSFQFNTSVGGGVPAIINLVLCIEVNTIFRNLQERILITYQHAAPVLIPYQRTTAMAIPRPLHFLGRREVVDRVGLTLWQDGTFPEGGYCRPAIRLS